MPHVRRNVYQHEFDFDRSRIVASGIAIYRSIAARVGQDTMIVCTMRDRWIEDEHTERRVESRLPIITNSWENRLRTLRALMAPRALNQEMELFTTLINHDEY